MEFIVAIDGPAGTGKGSVSKALAEKTNFLVMDTGAMYRCVTIYLLENNIQLEDVENVEEALRNIKIDIKEVENEKHFYLNGRDVSEKIRTKEVDGMVSQVSHIPCVRKAMVDLQRSLAEGKKIILEGRDIGTNVFPNANVKIYLDATPEERARRRCKQNEEKGIKMTYEEALENVKFRDYNDQTSDVAPLKQAEDAVYIDGTNFTIDETVEKIEKIINERMEKLQ